MYMYVFIKFSISPEFLPLLIGKDLLHKFFKSLRGIKRELHAKSFQVNDIRVQAQLRFGRPIRPPKRL